MKINEYSITEKMSKIILEELIKQVDFYLLKAIVYITDSEELSVEDLPNLIKDKIIELHAEYSYDTPHAFYRTYYCNDIPIIKAYVTQGLNIVVEELYLDYEKES